MKASSDHSLPKEIRSQPFYISHGELLQSSFQRFFDQPLMNADSLSVIQALYNAPFALVSHGTEDDPIFNFGNKTALSLFEMSWDEFTQLPSRYSAEPVSREERANLLHQVTTHGYIKDYTGVRISSTGKRFLIEDAIVWNLLDSNGVYRGQAAMIEKWTFL